MIVRSLYCLGRMEGKANSSPFISSSNTGLSVSQLAIFCLAALQVLVFSSLMSTNVVYGRLQRYAETLLNIESQVHGNFVISQSLLSLKSDAPGKRPGKGGRSGKKTGAAPPSRSRLDSLSVSFDETMNDLAERLEQFSIGDEKPSLVVVACDDIWSFNNYMTGLVMDFRSRISSVSNLSTLKECLDKLLSIGEGEGHMLEKLTQAIEKVNSALYSQANLKRELLRVLADSQGVQDSLSIYVSKCNSGVGPLVNISSVRYKQIFGHPDKIERSKVRISSFIEFVTKVYSQTCTDDALGAISLAIQGMAGSEGPPQMEVDEQPSTSSGARVGRSRRRKK